MNDSNPTVIETTGLAKTHKSVQALQPLDLQRLGHSVCGFLGPNGSRAYVHSVVRSNWILKKEAKNE